MSVVIMMLAGMSSTHELPSLPKSDRRYCGPITVSVTTGTPATDAAETAERAATTVAAVPATALTPSVAACHCWMIFRYAS